MLDMNAVLGAKGTMLGQIVLGRVNTSAEIAATSILTLTDAASAHLAVMQAAANSPLSLVSTAVVQCVYARPAYSDLIVTDDARHSALLRLNVLAVLDVTDSAAVAKSKVFTVAAGDTLSLGQSVIAHLCRVGSSALSLTDEATWDRVRLVANNLTLDQSASRNVVVGRGVLQVLALTQTATVQRAKSRDASSLLALTDAAGGIKVKVVTNTLALTQAAACDRCRPAVSSLSLTDAATVLTNHVVANSQLLTLTHMATAGFVRSRRVTQALNLLQSVAWTGPHLLSVENVLDTVVPTLDPATGTLVDQIIGLQGTAVVQVARAVLAVQQALSFGQRAVAVLQRSDAIPVEALDSLALSGLAVVNAVPHAASALTPSDVATVVASKLLGNAVSMSQAAAVNVVRGLSAADDIGIDDAVAFTIHRANIEWQYHPLVGKRAGSDPLPPPAALDGFAVSPSNRCRFVYPVAHPAEEISLRNPEFGNKDRLQFNRINRETRGGTLVVYADPIWPKVEIQVLTFTGLSQDQARGLLTFMASHLGELVGFLDWEGRYWQGVITNPNDAVVHDGRGAMFTASLEFECEPATWVP